MTDKLKPCPFCGYADVIVINPNLKDYFSKFEGKRAEVVCPNCEVGCNYGLFPINTDTNYIIRYVTDKWNRRADNDR